MIPKIKIEEHTLVIYYDNKNWVRESNFVAACDLLYTMMSRQQAAIEKVLGSGNLSITKKAGGWYWFDGAIYHGPFYTAVEAALEAVKND